jgi:glycosyltransferase involved in cell wall biosynthesis
MPDNIAFNSNSAQPIGTSGSLEYPVNVVFLPNVRMGPKRAALVAESGPDPLREVRGFERYGVIRAERDLHSYPSNLLAKKGSLLAGLDILRALKTLVFDRDADVIVSVFESNVLFILMLRKLFRFKPRIVLWEVSGRGWKMRDRILDYVVPRVDRVLVLTEAQRQEVEAHYRLRHPAQLLGFAIDDHFFHPAARKANERYVLAVGDDVSRDYPALIEACRLANLPLKLRSSAKLSVPENTPNVSFVGRLSYKELRDLYAEATIVVVPLKPADYPSGITAIYEAMAMGKPLIASRTGTSCNFIRHGEDGILVDPQNPVELGNALSALWNDEPARDALGAAARKRLDCDFSYDQYIQRFAAFLRQAAGR